MATLGHKRRLFKIAANPRCDGKAKWRTARPAGQPHCTNIAGTNRRSFVIQTATCARTHSARHAARTQPIAIWFSRTRSGRKTKAHSPTARAVGAGRARIPRGLAIGESARTVPCRRDRRRHRAGDAWTQPAGPSIARRYTRVMACQMRPGVGRHRRKTGRKEGRKVLGRPGVRDSARDAGIGHTV